MATREENCNDWPRTVITGGCLLVAFAPDGATGNDDNDETRDKSIKHQPDKLSFSKNFCKPDVNLVPRAFSTIFKMAIAILNSGESLGEEVQLYVNVFLM